MPANLTPEYLAAEKRFKEAKTTEERIEALEKMLAVIPKHKGTEKMRGEMKKRLSKLRNQDDKEGGKREDPYKIPREGAGRCVIAGTPNAGKSSLLKSLTNATPEIAPYPFTTVRPAPGMMRFEDIQIQLIDTGPVTIDRVEMYHSNLARGADVIICAIDLGAKNPAAQFFEVRDIFDEIKVRFVKTGPEEQHPFQPAEISSLIAACKYDLDDEDILLNDFRSSAGTDIEIIPVSAETGHGMDELKKRIFLSMNIVRIYSKIPGKPPDMTSPFVLRAGGTVLDVARIVHKDFSEKLKYARIWGSQRFNGQMVQRDYIVQDKDIIELHM